MRGERRSPDHPAIVAAVERLHQALDTVYRDALRGNTPSPGVPAYGQALMDWLDACYEPPRVLERGENVSSTTSDTKVAPDFDDSAHLDEMALILFRLVAYPTWMRRRTDRITLPDEWRLRQHLILEFGSTDINRVLGHTTWLSQLPVPLTMHAKEFLTDFRMTDAEGRDLSMLTVGQDRPIVSRMLHLVARSILGTEVVPAVSGLLHRITGPTREAQEAAAELQRLPEASELLKVSLFKGMIRDLVGHFFVMVLLENEGDRGHYIQIAFDDWKTERRVARPHAWSFPSVIALPLPAGQAASYHAEIYAPPGLRFDHRPRAVQWGGFDSPGATRAVVTHEGVVMVYAANGRSPGVVTLPVALRNRRGGAALMAEIVAFATAMIFVAALAGRGLFSLLPSGDAGPAAAVLTAIPAIYALVVLRPSEHPVTDQYTVGARVSIAMTGLLALSGAAVLAVAFPTAPGWLAQHAIGWRFFFWGVLSFFLVVMAAATTLLRAHRW
jgi:hypothetical protein